jgi:hypothetical protein
MRERCINPFTDFGFKRLFGEEPNKNLLLDFITRHSRFISRHCGGLDCRIQEAAGVVGILYAFMVTDKGAERSGDRDLRVMDDGR